MGLEKFFENGNKLAVFGSFLYFPEQARDVDFTLFTNQGRNPFSCSPAHSEQITRFLEDKLGCSGMKLDFVGKIRGNGPPYNLDSLPKKDPWLDGILLTGEFFPDRQFLEQHYAALFGKNYLIATWLRFAEDVKSFSLSETRLEKRQKDMPMMVKATKTLAQAHPEIRFVLNKYIKTYKLLMQEYRAEELGTTDYYLAAEQLAQDFIKAVAEVLSSSQHLPKDQDSRLLLSHQYHTFSDI